jgi:integrase/recombinase XerD
MFWLLSGIDRQVYHNQDMSVDGQIEAFLEMLAAERGAAANTLAAYQTDLRDFATVLAASGRRPGEADPAAVQNYLAGAARRGISARTQARRLSTLRQFFIFLLREGIRSDNPTEDSTAPKLPRTLPKYLTETEVEALLLAARALPVAQALRASAGLEILYSTGLRISELLALPATALSTDAAMIIIRGKGGRERIVPLSDAARAAAAALRAATQNRKRKSRYLFSGRDPGIAMSRQGFALLLKQVALRAAIEPTRLSPHVLRHSFASHMLAHGADLRSLQKLLGHADIATTEIYTHVMQERLRQLVEAHHPLAEG